MCHLSTLNVSLVTKKLFHIMSSIHMYVSPVQIVCHLSLLYPKCPHHVTCPRHVTICQWSIIKSWWSVSSTNGPASSSNVPCHRDFQSRTLRLCPSVGWSVDVIKLSVKMRISAPAHPSVTGIGRVSGLVRGDNITSASFGYLFSWLVEQNRQHGQSSIILIKPFRKKFDPLLFQSSDQDVHQLSPLH